MSAQDNVTHTQELLEACQYVLNWINDGCPKFDKIHTRTKIEAAIAKAEGRA